MLLRWHLSYAIDRGEINSDTQIDEALSGYKGIYYELCDADGKIICKIPQGIVAKKLEDKGFKSNPMTESETREKAVLWVKSMGYPIPSKMGGCLAFYSHNYWVNCLCYSWDSDFVMGLVSGQPICKRDMRQIVVKWVDAGKPTPGKKENLERPLEIVPEKNSEEEMEQKLKDLLSMKERKVISDEEYKEMRKKILGL